MPPSQQAWKLVVGVLERNLARPEAVACRAQAELLLKAMAAGYGRLTGELAERGTLAAGVVQSIVGASCQAFACAVAGDDLVIRAARMLEALAAGQDLDSALVTTAATVGEVEL